MTGVLVAVTSDWHTNSTIGLCPPAVNLDDGGTYRASKAQRWLWRNWLDFWQHVAIRKEETAATVIAITNGDAADGDHHDTPQLITRNPETQLRIAVAVAQPMLDVADYHYMMRGTEAHNGKNNWMEEAIARDIGAVESPYDTASHWHLYAKFGGVTFDVMHHPESGSMRPWTAGGEVNRIAAILAFEYARTGDKPPDIALRAHKHGYRDSGTTFDTRAFITPPWQLTTAFGHRIGVGGKVQSVGGLLFYCEKGRYTLERKFYRAHRGKPQELPTDG